MRKITKLVIVSILVWGGSVPGQILLRFEGILGTDVHFFQSISTVGGGNLCAEQGGGGNEKDKDKKDKKDKKNPPEVPELPTASLMLLGLAAGGVGYWSFRRWRNRRKDNCCGC